MAFVPELTQDSEQVAGESGVVQRGTEMLRTPAGPHVESMGREAGAQRRGGHAAHVSGLARAFEAMHQDDRGAGCTAGLYQHLHAGLRLEEAPLRRDVSPRPEVAGDGLQMRIAEQRTEWRHQNRRKPVV